jgi:hypothetical protein
MARSAWKHHPHAIFIFFRLCMDTCKSNVQIRSAQLNTGGADRTMQLRPTHVQRHVLGHVPVNPRLANGTSMPQALVWVRFDVVFVKGLQPFAHEQVL